MVKTLKHHLPGDEDSTLQDKAASSAETEHPVPPPLTRAAGVPAAKYGLDVLPPLSALVELTAIFAVLLAIDWLWPALDFNNVQPSPYWLAVLLLSLQYGTASGSIAAIVSIAVYFALATLPEQGVGENEFAYRLRILAQPIGWIATAVFLGQFRMVQIAAKRELMLKLAELEAQSQTLAGYANRLRGRCDTLERDIVARSGAEDRRLLTALAKLRDPASAAGPAIADCLAAAYPGGTVSLYVRTPAGWQRAASAGWPEPAPWLDLIPLDHPLASAIAAKRSLNVVRSGDEFALAGQGLAAIPVVNETGGAVTAMIKVEAAEARFLTENLDSELAVLANALSCRVPGLAAQPRPAAPIQLRPLAVKPEVASFTGSDPSSDSASTGTDRVRPKAGH